MTTSPDSPKVASRTEFPRRSLFGSIALTVITVVLLVIQSGDSHDIIEEFESRSLSTEKTCAQITHLDEVLTMSALMAAATGDLAWQDRYDRHVSILDRAIETAQQLAPDAASAAGTEDTNTANTRLIELETQSFNLVRQGRADEALQLLEGAEYAANKKIYAKGTQRLLLTLRRQVDVAITAERVRHLRIIIVTAFGLAFLMFLWLRVVRVVLNHAREREEYEHNLTQVADELGKANQELSEARTAADAAAAAKGAFVATVSHELRTPMNGVIGCATLLAETELTEDQKDLIDAIQASGQCLLTLVNDVLDFSKIEANKMSLEMLPDQPSRVITHVESMLAQTAKSKGLSLVLKDDGTGSQPVLIDPVRLGQVLVNLVGNAIKFTESGSVEIEFKSRPLDGNRVELEFCVHDTGIGVSEENLDTLFDDFVQAESSTNRRFGGTGLGLSISRKLAHLMGGDIFVESVLGCGTTFRVTLPTALAELVSQPAKTDREAKAQTKAHILLAEDNPINQMIIQRQLEQLGCTVDVVENGVLCIESLDAQSTRADADRPYDLIFMDCQMPLLNGVETTRQIRSREGWNWQHIPIIALTANALEADRERCLTAGMSGYLSKPTRMEELRDAILSHSQVDAESSQDEAA